MNYARIYAAFIDDRKAKQPQAPEYFEKHHIKPRCLGGGDDPENIIRLSPEDHLFAHLLLAKIFGGALWSAVFLMSGSRGHGRNRGKPRATRKLRAAYGLARRAWSEHERGKDGLKGSENGNYNPTIFQWRHLDTDKRVAATLHEMWVKYGGTRGTWTAAATPGSGKPSVAGWTIDDGKHKLRSSKGKEFSFINADGRSFVGTQSAFCAMAGVAPSAATRVVRYASVTLCGWRLVDTKQRESWARKSNGKAANTEYGRTYFAMKNGKTVRGSRHKVAAAVGVTPGALGAAASSILKDRKRGNIYKGWLLRWQDPLF